MKDVVQSFEGFKAVAEQGIALAYADVARKYANGSGTAKDCDKAIEYFQKTVDAGLLAKHDAQEFMYFINDNPDVSISDELRVHLMRTISISLPYWFKIQKRINNIQTL